MLKPNIMRKHLQQASSMGPRTRMLYSRAARCWKVCTQQQQQQHPHRQLGAIFTRWQQSHSTGFRFLGPLQQHAAIDHHVQASRSDISFEDLVINRAQTLKPRPDASNLKFGAETTDHMLQVLWNEEQGWMAPEINALKPFTIHPCAQVLHYATECFEGMKAYKDKDGRVRLFRPLMHMDRLLRSAQRLALPEFDKVSLLECIQELVRVEREWIPEREGFSLYIRPTIIATHACLGVQAAKEAMLFVVMSPVGPYFTSGLKPITLFVDTKNVRAHRGGVGDKKLGGNYGPTIVPQLEAARRGCSQVLYVLDEEGRGLVSEAGSMNIFFLLRNYLGQMELVTPALDGTILPGVTRDTVLAISRKIGGLRVSERRLEFSEIEEAAARDDLVEAFGTGTACMIQPIAGLLKDSGHQIRIPFDSEAANSWIARDSTTTTTTAAQAQSGTGMPFSLCGYLTRAMMDIHHGHTQSEWSVLLD